MPFNLTGTIIRIMSATVKFILLSSSCIVFAIGLSLLPITGTMWTNPLLSIVLGITFATFSVLVLAIAVRKWARPNSWAVVSALVLVPVSAASLTVGVAATSAVPRIGTVYFGSPLNNWANVWEQKCDAQTSADDPGFTSVPLEKLFPSANFEYISLDLPGRPGPDEADIQTYIATYGTKGDAQPGIYIARTYREKGEFSSTLYRIVENANVTSVLDQFTWDGLAITDIEFADGVLFVAGVTMVDELMHLQLLSGEVVGERLSSVTWETNFLSSPGIDTTVTPGNPGQGGGHILPLEDGKILLSVGDFRMGPSTLAEQLVDYDFRELLAPESDYGATHVISRAGENSLFTWGNRNPLGLAMDSAGNIWESEHAAGEGNEINLLVQGEDYGWRDGTRGIPYGGFSNLRDAEFAEEYAERFSDPLVGIGRFCRSDSEQTVDPVVTLSGSGNHPPGELEILPQGFAGIPSESLILGTMKSRSLVLMELQDGDIVDGKQSATDFRFRDMSILGDQLWITTDEDGPLVVITG